MNRRLQAGLRYGAAVIAGAVLTPVVGTALGTTGTQPFAAGHTCPAPGTPTGEMIAYGTACASGAKTLEAYLQRHPPVGRRVYVNGFRCETAKAARQAQAQVAVRCLQTQGIQFVAEK